MENLNNLYHTMFTTYKDIVNVKQMSEMLGIGIALAYKLVRQKTIKSMKIGREYKIPKVNIIKYVISNN